MSKDLNALIRNARRPERSVEVFIAGDGLDSVLDEYERLQQEMEAAGDDDSIDGGTKAEKEARIAELREALADFKVKIRFRALDRLKYDALLDEHPPRRDAAGDVIPGDLVGYNRTTFYPALVRACWSAPELAPGVMDHLLDSVLSDWQFDSLANAALLANRGKVDIPF